MSQFLLESLESPLQKVFFQFAWSENNKIFGVSVSEDASFYASSCFVLEWRAGRCGCSGSRSRGTPGRRPCFRPPRLLYKNLTRWNREKEPRTSAKIGKFRQLSSLTCFRPPRLLYKNPTRRNSAQIG